MAGNLRILRKVRKEFDYQSFVEENFLVKYSTKGELRICCPHCGDQSFKCYVNDEKKYFNCFKCDFNSGNFDVFDFVAISEGITRGQSMLKLTREYAEVSQSWQEIIDSVAAVEVDDDEIEPKVSIKYIPSLPSGAVPMSLETKEEHQVFWDYLSARGFTDKEILDTKAHCFPSSRGYIFDENRKLKGNVGHRVLFPVYGIKHKLVAWQARSIDGSDPKYFNAPDSDIAHTLWPCVPSPVTTGVLVEGIIDALAVRRTGFSSYATFGKKISYGQIALLKEWDISSLILFWDKKDAKREMLSAIEVLKMHFDTVYVPDFSVWPKDKDSGDTLNWEEGATLMQDMLSNHLIDVNSMEFALWKAN